MKILVEHILPGLHYESISENSGGAYLVGGSTMNPLQEMLVEHILPGFHYESISENAGGACSSRGSTKISHKEMLVENLPAEAQLRSHLRKFWWRTDRQRATKIYFFGDLVELAMRYPH